MLAENMGFGSRNFSRNDSFFSHNLVGRQKRTGITLNYDTEINVAVCLDGSGKIRQVGYSLEALNVTAYGTKMNNFC